MRPRTLEDGDGPRRPGVAVPEDFAGHEPPAARCFWCGAVDGLVQRGERFQCREGAGCAPDDEDLPDA